VILLGKNYTIKTGLERKRDRKAYLIELSIIDLKDIVWMGVLGKLELSNGDGRESLNDRPRPLGRTWRGASDSCVLGSLKTATEIACIV